MPSPMESGQGESVPEDPDPNAIIHVSREPRGGAVHLSSYALTVHEGSQAVGIFDPVKNKLLGLAWIKEGEHGDYIETEIGSELCAEPFSTRQKLMSRLIVGADGLTEAGVSSAVIRTPWQPSSESFTVAARNTFGDTLNFVSAEIGEEVEVPAKPNAIDNVRHLGGVAAQRELETAAA
jgi:hypothetical protein